MPSPQLVERLQRFELCSPADLRLCEPLVTQMCRDLPDFDSVWLDALVQLRFLTRYQAELLAEPEREVVIDRDLLLTERLGRRTEKAIDRSSRKVVVLRELHVSQTTPAHASGRMQQLLDSLSASDRPHPGIVLPLRILPQASGEAENASSTVQQNAEDACGARSGLKHPTLAVFPWTPGWRLDELLIRGGRLPWQAVAEVGRDLLQGMTWLESSRLLHGDIATCNVILTPSGNAVLTGALVRRVEQPAVVFSDQLTLRDCEGVAPEQVGTARPADARSELYALGCVLWNALTSRPIVLSADPVTRLTTLRKQDVADVRLLVPDCPDWMAELLLSMTRRTPELRPASAADVLKQWSRHCGHGHRHCRKLLATMPDRKRYQNAGIVSGRRRTSGPIRRLLTTVVLLLTITGIGYYGGLTPQVLRFGRTSSPQVGPDPGSEITSHASSQDPVIPAGTADAPIAMPQPDADGIVRLQPNGHYLAAILEGNARLDVVCDETAPATVYVSPDRLCLLKASDVSVGGVCFQPRDSRESDGPAKHALLYVTSRTLSLRKTLFNGGTLSADPRNAPSMLVWEDESGSRESLVELHDCAFDGAGGALRFHSVPGSVRLRNVLFLTTGPALHCNVEDRDITADETSNPTVPMSIQMEQTTLWGGSSLMTVALRSRQQVLIQLNIQCGESVLCPSRTMTAFGGPSGTRPEQFQVAFTLPETGNPAVIPPQTILALFADPQLRMPAELAPEQIQSDGLMAVTPEFRGELADGFAAYELLDYEGPKLRREMPGIRSADLPARQQRGPALNP
ncbi:MAG: protein kinase [Planctomycetaceae bacterium]|nr:protein kinase [Planctomycetaceae bacterium]